MKSRRWLAAFVVLGVVSSSLPYVRAQAPGVLYTWDQSYGETTGANTEGWSKNFGNNDLTLDNVTDGVMTVTETGTAGSDWAITDAFDRVREATNPMNGGGLDLTGLSSIELEIGHNGPNPVNGQLFTQTPTGATACCDFTVLGGITVNPGAPQIVSVPLASIASNYDAISYLRTIGLQMFDHAADGNLTWSIREVRSAGTPLSERYIGKHDAATGPANLDGAVVKFDQAAISGGVGDAQTGLSVVASDTAGSGSLRWVDLAGGPGAAIAWGNGRAAGSGLLSVDYSTRPMDLSNYNYVAIRMRAQPGSGADPTLDVQFYVQSGVPGVSEFSYQNPADQNLPVDSQYHELIFPLAGLQGMNFVQWAGINLGSHAGNMDVRVDYVRFFTAVPEPATATLLVLGACVGVFAARKRS